MSLVLKSFFMLCFTSYDTLYITGFILTNLGHSYGVLRILLVLLGCLWLPVKIYRTLIKLFMWEQQWSSTSWLNDIDCYIRGFYNVILYKIMKVSKWLQDEGSYKLTMTQMLYKRLLRLNTLSDQHIGFSFFKCVCIHHVPLRLLCHLVSWAWLKSSIKTIKARIIFNLETPLRGIM